MIWFHTNPMRIECLLGTHDSAESERTNVAILGRCVPLPSFDTEDCTHTPSHSPSFASTSPVHRNYQTQWNTACRTWHTEASTPLLSDRNPLGSRDELSWDASAIPATSLHSMKGPWSWRQSIHSPEQSSSAKE